MSNGTTRILVGLVLVILGFLTLVVSGGLSFVLVVGGLIILWLGYSEFHRAEVAASIQSTLEARNRLVWQMGQPPPPPSGYRPFAGLPPPPPAVSPPGPVVVHVAAASPSPVYMRCSHCHTIGNMLAGKCPSCGAPY